MGGGSIFAFSGLEGRSTIENSLAGYLKSDGVGVIFDCSTLVELAFDIKQATDLSFNIVSSDIVHFKTEYKGIEKESAFAFLNEDTVIGFSHKNTISYIVCADIKERNPEEGIIIYTTASEHIAFIKRNEKEEVKFALSVSKKSENEAIQRAKKGISKDICQLMKSRYQFFGNLPRAETNNETVEKTLTKCFSILKSQVYSPEGNIKCRWTTPDRIPHKKMWLWDSVFHALGNKYISKDLAIETIGALFYLQNEEGFIPHMASPDIKSDITQPPIIAWGVYKLYEYINDKDIPARFYDALKKYLMWNFKNRDKNQNNLFEWEVNIDNPNCRCDECGMDNSPRFDSVEPMDCIDFSCYMANETRHMAKIAAVLGLNDEAIYWGNKHENIKTAINDLLWDEQDEFYYDRKIEKNEFKKVQAVSSFLPLFAGVCDLSRAEKLVKHLVDENKFNTPFPIPSIAVDDPTFGTDMWRGPVWINYNYMIACGLKEYGFNELAQSIVKKTINTISFWYNSDGVIYEFYDSYNRVSPSKLNRKGKPVNPYNYKIRMQTIRDYGWSASLFAEMTLNSML